MTSLEAQKRDTNYLITSVAISLSSPTQMLLLAGRTQRLQLNQPCKLLVPRQARVFCCIWEIFNFF